MHWGQINALACRVGWKPPGCRRVQMKDRITLKGEIRTDSLYTTMTIRAKQPCLFIYRPAFLNPYVALQSGYVTVFTGLNKHVVYFFILVWNYLIHFRLNFFKQSSEIILNAVCRCDGWIVFSWEWSRENMHYTSFSGLELLLHLCIAEIKIRSHCIILF